MGKAASIEYLGKAASVEYLSKAATLEAVAIESKVAEKLGFPGEVVVLGGWCCTRWPPPAVGI